jgi:phage FluMu protein gp41
MAILRNRQINSVGKIQSSLMLKRVVTVGSSVFKCLNKVIVLTNNLEVQYMYMCYRARH